MLDRILFGPNDGTVYSRRKEKASNSVFETLGPNALPITQDLKQPIHATNTVISPVESSTVAMEPAQDASNKRSDGIMFYWKQLWERPPNTWHPSIWQMRSIAGLSALCAVVGCMFASLAVLVLSNESPTDHWPIQPTVRIPTMKTPVDYETVVDLSLLCYRYIWL